MGLGSGNKDDHEDGWGQGQRSYLLYRKYIVILFIFIHEGYVMPYVPLNLGTTR